MTREEKVLKALRRDGLGLEIGPSFRPIAPKREGYRVEIVDSLGTAMLREKYAKHGTDVDQIEEVDYVWSGQSYAELTKKTKHYDWVIASHVVEHVPDLIGFLNNCDEVLKDDGVLSLVVPDKRYCFDVFRPPSALASVIDAHLRKVTVASPGAVAEFMLHAASCSGQIAWTRETPEDFKLLCTPDEARAEMKAVMEGQNRDVHVWTFTPHTFRVMICALDVLGLTKMREACFEPTEGHEFFVSLGRSASGLPISYFDALKAVQSERAACS